MSNKKFTISLRIIILVTLLLVGIVPLFVTGWFLSDESGRELRSAEGRYQTQLVQDKARQIETFGKDAIEIVGNYKNAFEIANDADVLSSEKTQEKLGKSLHENSNLLALFIKPLKGESLSAFRNEVISRSEIQKFSESAIGQIDKQNLAIGQPQMIENSGEIVFAVASPIYIEGNLSAAMVAIISLNGISQIVSEQQISENEMWKMGLPIIFVVDEKGRAIYHPNSANVTSRKSLTGLRIVDEWTATNDQIQSALLPFSAKYKDEEFQMIGAYSTSNFNDQLRFGVIVMQDENKSLAVVNQMRTQVWGISFAVAFVVLLLGLILARQMTYPLSNLVEAAKRIAAGDLSHRIKTKKISEINVLGEAFNSMSEDLEEHIDNLAKSAEENRQLFIGTVKALAAAIDGKDKYTRGHSERVSRVSMAIGQRLGMNEEELEKLRISSLLHDVGKIAIDDSILKKPAALTDDEYEIMKTHPKAGYKIMKNIPAMEDFLPGMYMHHEMVNGKGYPQGLSDDEIPLQAKIVSVADTFDAMTIDRPYQKGMELGAALDRIKDFVGTRYDIMVVDALIRACADGQIGIGRVKLKNFNPDNNISVNPKAKDGTKNKKTPQKHTNKSMKVINKPKVEANREQAKLVKHEPIITKSAETKVHSQTQIKKTFSDTQLTDSLPKKPKQTLPNESINFAENYDQQPLPEPQQPPEILQFDNTIKPNQPDASNENIDLEDAYLKNWLADELDTRKH